jgi:hypothetical protein
MLCEVIFLRIKQEGKSTQAFGIIFGHWYIRLKDMKIFNQTILRPHFENS